MSDLIQTGFDYAALPVDLAVSLKLHEDRFIAVRNRATYEMGKEIYEAQQELANHKNGCFQSWVEHLGISYQTGYDLITIYQNEGTDIIKLFDNKKLSQTVAVMLLRSPESVVDKAVAKAESGEKVTVADVKDWKAELEAERQRREAAEKVLLEEQQRCCEFGAESNERRLKIRELETHIAGLERRINDCNAQPDPQPIFVEKPVIPADYETAKATAAKLKEDLAAMRKKQDELVAAQVKAKLREREKELADLDRQAKDAELRLQSLNKQIDSYSSVERMTRLQRDQIEKCRSMLAELAANMEGFDRLENDPKTDQLWAALADMLRNGADAIDFFTGVHHPGLSLIA